MKNFGILFLFFFIVCGGHAQSSLQGRILAAPTDKVFLFEHKGFDLKKISTASIDPRGNFYFTIPKELSLIRGFYRLQFSDSVFADLVLSPEEKIFIKINAFWMQDSLKVENSPENDAFMKMRALQLVFFDNMKRLQEEYSRLNANDTAVFAKKKMIESDYEGLQRQHNQLLDTFSLTYAATFSGKLAKMERIPLMSDFPEAKDKYQNQIT